MHNRGEFTPSRPAYNPQASRLVSDFRPVTKPIAQPVRARAVHETIVPPKKPKLTAKRLWRERPRSLTDLLAGLKTVTYGLLRKAKRIVHHIVQIIWHPKRSAKSLISSIHHLSSSIFSAIRHPRRSFRQSARFVRANWPQIIKTAAALGAIVFASLFLFHYFNRFSIAPKAMELLPTVSVDRAKIKLVHGQVTYNAAQDFKEVAGKSVVADPTDATNGTNLYTATIDLNPGKGMTFGLGNSTNQNSPSVPGLPAGASQTDENAKLSFSLTPLGGGVQKGRLTDNRLQYPSSDGQRFYTFRKNGVAEDILLTKAPANTATYQWKLDLPNSLEARMMPNGAVGIYSANPELFGNIQVGDQKSQDLLDKARKNGQKDTLAFVLPAPFIKTTDGKTDTTHTKFSLSKDNVLTLIANGLQRLSYPLSIDPSVVVTTTGDFQTGYDDGMVDYGTSGQMNRGGISSGSVGSVTTTNSMIDAVYGNATIAYNGYMYTLGGWNVGSPTCQTTSGGNILCSAVEVASISGGTTGTWQFTCNGAMAGTYSCGFSGPRRQLAAAVYNGYLYVLGGCTIDNSGACGAGGYNNDVQYALICNGSNNGVGGCSTTAGALGTWSATTSFATGRERLQAATYNGYMYVMGGLQQNTNTSCNTVSSQFCADVQYARINADGTLGSWQATTSLGFGRYNFGMTMADGYIYVAGGSHPTSDTLCNGAASTLCSDVQFAPINLDGTIGSWQYTCNNAATASFSCGFTNERYGLQLRASQGYLYMYGGNHSGSSSNCSTNYCLDVQAAAMNPNGTVGPWNTMTLSFPNRTYFGGVLYGGYLFAVGGDPSGGGATSSVQSVQLLSMGAAAPSIQQTNTFTIARYDNSLIAYNGYIYMIGGDQNGNPNTNCSPTSSSYCSDAQRCPLNNDGSLGTCIRQTGAITTARRGQSSVVANGYLYIIGGDNGPALNDIQYAWIDTANGGRLCLPSNHATCGPTNTVVFAQETGAFTSARSNHTSLVYNGYLYIVGGQNFGLSAYYNDIQYSWLNPSTGAACLPSNHATCGPTNTIVFTQQTNALNTNHAYHASVSYNGYLYVIGGSNGAGYLNDIQFCPFNSNGSVGTCHYTHNGVDDGTSFAAGAFSTPRNGHAAVIFNGYIEIVGGADSSSNYLNDIQSCPINSDGTVGACTQQTNAFTTGRQFLNSVTANGYLYITEGYNSTSGVLNDTLHLWLGQMGQSGTSTTNASGFTTARLNHGTVAYNGYLYIVGGYDNGGVSNDCVTTDGICQGIQYCPLNANGSVGACHYTHAGQDDSTTYVAGMLTPRQYPGLAVYKGYLYIVGGNDSNNGSPPSGCDSQGRCVDIQFCPINANGTIGSAGGGYTCHYTHGGLDDGTTFVAAALNFNRDNQATAVANGYLYTIGGFGSGGVQNDIEYCPINGNGTVGTCTRQTGVFTSGRQNFSAVVYNGYLYVIGGIVFGGGGTGCEATYCHDIQYAWLDPSTGNVCQATAHSTCSSNTNVFTQELNAIIGRQGPVAGAYNGNLYVAGGSSASYLNDVQVCPISSSGWVGACSEQSSAFTTARRLASSAIVNGYMYITGGYSGSAQSDIQYIPLSSTPLVAPYEREVDVGNAAAIIQSIVYNGSATCGVTLQYATAGSNAQFGTVTTSLAVQPGATISVNASNKRYVWVRMMMDDQSCGGQSDITDITVNYIISPGTPSTISPSPGTTGIITLTPSFTLRSSDPLNDNLKYKLTICTDAALTLNCKSADQTSSQTGWSGQDAGGGTAYVGNATLTSSTIATYTYTGSPALNWSTTYYWQGSACDSTDTSNGCSLTPSTVQSFTTDYAPGAPTLSAPSSGQNGIITTPELRLYSNDQDSDYLRYEIILYDGNCSTQTQAGTGTYDENSSQTGWSGQSVQSGTAYSSGQTAIYKFQTALTANTQYCWKAAAKDPAGTNTFGSFSSTQTFTTQPAAKPQINIKPQGGDIKIYSGTTIGG